MDFLNVTLGVAFVAGLFSFFSPCVFALVPAYVSYLSGRVASGEEGGNPWGTLAHTLSHGLTFVLGFSVVFVTLGVATSAFGSLLYDMRYILAKVGGIVVVVLGLHMIGVYRIPFLEYDIRIQKMPDPKWGYLSSFLLGIFFSAGWSPCVGPVLGAILTLALNGGSVSKGASLLTAYSAGLAIPFLISAMFIGGVNAILREYGKVMRYVEIAMGIMMVVIGIMLFAGTFERLAQFGPWIDFGL